MGPYAGETEVLIPAGYVRTVYDATFVLSPDRKRYIATNNNTPTTLPAPGLPFSLVFRAEPGAEDANPKSGVGVRGGVEATRAAASITGRFPNRVPRERQTSDNGGMRPSVDRLARRSHRFPRIATCLPQVVMDRTTERPQGGPMSTTITRIGSLAAVVGCMASAVFAQGGNATISGTVFDQGKAVLPGATVTVTNEATGIARETVTGAEGRFVDPHAHPGTYTVRVELAGFQTQARAGSCSGSARS